MSSRRLQRSKMLLQRLVPAKVVKSQLHRHVYVQFADKLGLVYFGYVDQRNDEHRLVRGLTVSATHRDNHYCIGSFEGYDVALVERTDTIRFPGKTPKVQDSIIMSFDLQRLVDLPHVFIGLHTQGDAFYAQLFTKFAHFQPVQLLGADGYDKSFTSKYSMYAKPTQALSASRLFHPEVTKVIAERFGGLTVEISNSTLYLYAEHQRPTLVVLERMLRYGSWLAKTIDQGLNDVS